MKLSEALKMFLIDRELKGSTEKTLENYQQQVQYFIDFTGDIDTSDLTLELLKEYQTDLMHRDRYIEHPIIKQNEGKISKITVQSYIRQLRIFVNYLYKEEIVETDFCKKFLLPKATRKVINILTDEEKDMILNSYTEKSELQLRNKCMIALMLDSGLRRNEVIQLNYDDVNLPYNYIKVSGKGQKERIVPIGLTTKKLLIKYMNKRSKPDLETKRLFIDKEKKPITDNAIKMIFQRLRKKTGIDRLHPHMLRHTFATDYLVNGGDMFSLQHILGHTSLEMVRKYSHLASSYIISNHRRLSPLDEMQKRKYNH